MLLTVSTVKDTLPNVRRFVTHNLANGVDHMLVFLDGPDRAVEEHLTAHPHVTCVRSDSWWHDDRPAHLNVRQRINANAAKVALAPFEWAQWLFHIDGDECVVVDRDWLAGVDPRVQAVHLRPLEAVSRMRWEGEVTHFKRLLDDDDLTLLTTLGVIGRPANSALFNGYTTVKSGVRPSLRHWLTLHYAVDADDQPIPAAVDDRSRVLHYEAWSGEEFVRKWTTRGVRAPMVGGRPRRRKIALSLRTLLAKELAPEITRRYLMEIYARVTEDDFDTLRDLGLLERVDPSTGSHVPEPLPRGAAAGLGAVLDRLGAAPKRPFQRGDGAAEVVSILRSAADDLRGGGADLAARLDEVADTGGVRAARSPRPRSPRPGRRPAAR